MKELVVAHIRSERNSSDICTKVTGGGQKRQELVSMIIYDINMILCLESETRGQYKPLMPLHDEVGGYLVSTAYCDAKMSMDGSLRDLHCHVHLKETE